MCNTICIFCLIVASFVAIVSGYSMRNYESSWKIFRKLKLTKIRRSMSVLPNEDRPKKGFGQRQRPNVITPTPGNANNDKFMMMYTCKICNGRNSQMVSKVAYAQGMVISRCKHCDNKHLIADNESKLDMAEYGKTAEEYLEKQGETVQKLTVSGDMLKDHYLIEKDGQFFLYAKALGQPPADVNIIDVPIPNVKPSNASNSPSDSADSVE